MRARVALPAMRQRPLFYLVEAKHAKKGATARAGALTGPVAAACAHNECTRVRAAGVRHMCQGECIRPISVSAHRNRHGRHKTVGAAHQGGHACRKKGLQRWSEPRRHAPAGRVERVHARAAEAMLRTEHITGLKMIWSKRKGVSCHRKLFTREGGKWHQRGGRRARRCHSPTKCQRLTVAVHACGVQPPVAPMRAAAH